MKANKAFSVIEILLVIIITGIILGVSVPNFLKGYSQFQLNKTADDLLNVSRWAQAMAMGQQRIYALSFSDDRKYYLLERDGDNLTGDGQSNFEPVKGSLGHRHAVPEAVTLATPEVQVEFYPDGTIDPATIQLSSKTQKMVLSSTQVRGMMTKISDE
jgi:type II secretory pathway pseudopilin PulG